MLTPKRFLACRWAWVRALWSTQTSSSSGSSDTEANALAVMPWTSPSKSRVMIVTPVAKHPIASRNSVGLRLIPIWSFFLTRLPTLPRPPADGPGPGDMRLMYDSMHPHARRTENRDSNCHQDGRPRAPLIVCGRTADLRPGSGLLRDLAPRPI